MLSYGQEPTTPKRAACKMIQKRTLLNITVIVFKGKVKGRQGGKKPHRMTSADKRINDRSENSDKSSTTRGILRSVSTESVLCLGLPDVSLSNLKLDRKSPLIEFAADED